MQYDFLPKRGYVYCAGHFFPGLLLFECYFDAEIGFK